MSGRTVVLEAKKSYIFDEFKFSCGFLTVFFAVGGIHKPLWTVRGRLGGDHKCPKIRLHDSWKALVFFLDFYQDHLAFCSQAFPFGSPLDQ